MNKRLTQLFSLLIIIAVVAGSVPGFATTEANVELYRVNLTSEYVYVSGRSFDGGKSISLAQDGEVLAEASLTLDGEFGIGADMAPIKSELISGGKKAELDFSGFSELFGLEGENYNSFSLKMEREKFVLSGKHSGNTGVYVTMKILDKDGEIKAIGEKRSDENGEFSFEFYIREGVYTFDLKAEELPCVSCEINMADYSFGVDETDFTEVTNELESRLAELDDLREQCHSRGFTTDYEDVNIEIIRKFIGYMYEENEIGYSGSVGQYYYALIGLYIEAKADLMAYLNNEKTPLAVPKYVTSDLFYNGTNLYATAKTESGTEVRPVFFNGFGHFDTADKDTEFFNSIGLNVIQSGLPSVAGCFWTEKIPDYWNSVRSGGSTATFTETNETATEGKYSLKAQSSDAWQMGRSVYVTQEVSVKPDTTYVFSFKAKGTANSAESLQTCINDVYSAPKYGVTPSSAWKNYEFEYTTASNETSISVNFIITNKMDGMYVDNCCVKEKGTENNLLKNGGFECGGREKTDLDREAEVEGYYIRYNSIDDFRKVLEDAEKNNVLVDVGVFPHFLPTFLGQGAPSDYTDDGLNEMIFTPFKLTDEKVRKAISIYARLVGSIISEYDCVYSIGLVNEPGVLANKITENVNLREYYTPAWHDYLIELYDNDINKLRANHGISYNSFYDVEMPDNMEPTPLYYDYRCFNDKLLADFHKWFAEELHNAYPQYKLHTKIQQYFRSNYETYLERGTNYELIAPYMDINGCDAISSYASPTAPVSLKMAWYDFMTSIKDAPVFDTEAHVLSDGSYINYHSEHIRHSGADVWNSAVHGRSVGIYWLWERGDTATPWASGNYTHSNFAFRPEETAAIARANLDLNRLAYEVAALQRAEAKSALLYSRTSEGYTETFMSEMKKAYEGLIFSGQKVDFITDSNPDAIHDYELVVISEATNVSADTIAEIKKYLQGGGRLIIRGTDSLRRNEYNKAHNTDDIDYIYSHNNTFVDSDISETVQKLGLSDVWLADAETGNALDDVEWAYTMYNGRIVINVMNYDESGNKNIKVMYKGSEVAEITELRSGEKMTDIEAKPFEPMLLRMDLFSFDLTDGEGNVKEENIDTLKEGTIRCEANIDGILVLALYKDGMLVRTVIGENEIYFPGEDGEWRLMATVWDMEKISPVTQSVDIYN